MTAVAREQPAFRTKVHLRGDGAHVKVIGGADFAKVMFHEPGGSVAFYGTRDELRRTLAAAVASLDDLQAGDGS